MYWVFCEIDILKIVIDIQIKKKIEMCDIQPFKVNYYCADKF